MPGIYVMAALTIALTSMLGMAALNHLTGDGRRYAWLVLAGLPLSLLVNRLLKTPALTWLATWTGTELQLSPDSPSWFILAIWLNAPLFEEAIKLLPLILPASRTFLRDASHALGTGLALGLGFGLGEAAYLAYGLAQSAEYSHLPWYVFTGYAAERLIVTFAHGFLTALAVLGVYRGRNNALIGYGAAVGLHALINLGAILLALELVPAALSSLVIYASIVLTFLVFQRYEHAARRSGGISSPEIVYFER